MKYYRLLDEIRFIHVNYVILHIIINLHFKTVYKQARQTRPNSGGVAEGQPRFDKEGVAIIFYSLRVKNRTF